MGLDNISIILSRPETPGNIGSTARAMKNMGLSKLVLIDSEGHRSSDARIMGYNAEDILAAAETFSTLEDGLKGMGAVFGVTARQRKERKVFVTPGETAEELIKLSSKNKIAIVFGTERTGLTNEELRLCHQIMTIPTGETFTSLNLSQAVLIVCYEIFLASKTAKGGTPLSLAGSETVEAMFRDMRETFLRIGFLNPQSPDFILSGMRGFLGRASLTSSDIKILRGMIRHIDEYCTGGRSRRLDMKRFFVDEELVIENAYEINGEPFENLKKWEPRVGEAITVVDQKGREGRARILEQTKDECKVHVFEVFDLSSESPVDILLLQALPDKKQMKHIIQKASELGVAGIVPFKSEKSSALKESENKQKKAHEWNEIALKAARQCRRGRSSEIYDYSTFENAIVQGSVCDLKLILNEGVEGQRIKEIIREQTAYGSIALMVGPEGGFTKSEVDEAIRAGYVPVTLGQRILRTETAVIAALTILQYELGDLG
ncbi:MAG: TrmJ/YjtD family RNA methyltransferase [Thermodesulfobacteriota bacterium]